MKIPSWAWTTLAVLAVLFGAYAAGGRASRRAVELDQQKARERIRGQADEVAEEIEAMGDDALRDAASKWVRDGSER